MAIFYTDTGSLSLLEVSRSLTVSGSGSGIFKVTGSTGGIFEISDITSAGNLFTVTSASIDVLSVGSNHVKISASLITTGSIISTVNIFSRGGTVSDYTNGITNNQWYAVWRCPFSCSVTAMYGLRDGGTTAQINARRSGSTGYALHTGSNLTLTTQDVWTAVNSVQNVSYVAGDSLEIIISGSGGSPNQVGVQVDFVRV